MFSNLPHRLLLQVAVGRQQVSLLPGLLASPPPPVASRPRAWQRQPVWVQLLAPRQVLLQASLRHPVPRVWQRLVSQRPERQAWRPQAWRRPEQQAWRLQAWRQPEQQAWQPLVQVSPLELQAFGRPPALA